MRNFLLAAVVFVAACFFSAQTADAQQRGWGRSRVAYYPVITWYPQGTQMRTGVVVSPNRRYVRIGVNVGFSGVTQVHTFNFYNGRYIRRR